MPHDATWRKFWRFSPDCKSTALPTLGLVWIVSKSVCYCFRRPFHPNPLLEPGKYQHLQKYVVLLPGATFGGFPVIASRGHSCAWVWCKSHQSLSVGPIAGHSTRINWWNLENASISKSASWRSLEQLLAVFHRLQVEGSPALGFDGNRITVVLLVLSQAIPSESTVGTWKIPAWAKMPSFAPGSNFWRCPKTASRGLSWPLVWYESHQRRSVGAFAGHSIWIHCWNLENTSISKSTSFCSLEQLLAVFPWLQVEGSPALGFGAKRIKVGLLVLSQAIPPESTDGTWKIPALAKVPHDAPWSNRFLFSPNCKSTALPTLGLVGIVSKSFCWCFYRPFHLNPLLEPGKYQH